MLYVKYISIEKTQYSYTAICNNIDGPSIIVSEVSQRKTNINIIWYYFMWNLKNNTNESL